MKTNSLKIMTILSAMTMLMTSCDDCGTGYMVIPMWIVILVLVCFFCH